jgi:tetratricopeptide (TPR) repeat protein
MRTAVIIVASLLAIAMPSHAQSPTVLADSARIAIEAAVDRGDLAGLDAAIAQVDRALALHANDPLLRHYRGYALYRAGTIAYGQQDAGRARKYFESAAEILEPLAAGATIPETHAVLSAVYSMQIATSRVVMIAGMRLGPKVNAAMARAVGLGPRNPRVWVLRGIGAFNAPAAFGGGIDKAEAYLKTALELFATDAAVAPLPAWGRADAHAWLGQVYAKRGQVAAARAEYAAALALQPGHPWISGTLLPQLGRARGGEGSESTLTPSIPAGGHS